jgi:hypothetical protein
MKAFALWLGSYGLSLGTALASDRGGGLTIAALFALANVALLLAMFRHKRP